MRLFSRNVCVHKTYDETYQVIKSSNYRFSKGHFGKNCFAIHCPKRFNGGNISLFPIRGTILQCANSVEVVLSVHANVSFYVGCILCATGAIGSILHIVSGSPRWLPWVGGMLIGMLISGQVLWEGKSTLDILERKLLA